MSNADPQLRRERERRRLLPEPADACPVRDVLDHVGGRWPVLTMFVISEAGGAKRFGQIRRALPGISQRMLSKTLRELQRDGLILRRALESTPAAVEYSLTPMGESLLLPLRHMIDWANANFDSILRARERFLDSASALEAQETPITHA